MTKYFTTAEKLNEIGAIIDYFRRNKTTPDDRRLDILRAIALDLRGRLAGAPNAALTELERRVVSVERARTDGFDQRGPLIGAGQELIARWATVRLSLEAFGAQIENEP